MRKAACSRSDSASSGTLRRWAELLGLEEDATILEAIKAEEENADAVLSEISERVHMVGAA